jgi:oxygen-independent coproporphyrinogen-3 oxidase
VFSKELFDKYVDRITADIAGAQDAAQQLGCDWAPEADSMYFGGGTPSVLSPAQLQRVFGAVRETFQVERNAEVTVECAPGTLTAGLIEALVTCGVNRVSLGVQSFIDKECSSIGRLHTRQIVLDDIARLRAAGIDNISIDLIAGLPHQTQESWRYSLTETISTGVPHVSVYMLEVDEDSRLGRELIAGGTRYHAHFVPEDDQTADFYIEACETLNGSGISQYEISNFARKGCQSHHNLKYWKREPYIGFGVDAHSMLPAQSGSTCEAVRFATTDSLDAYLANAPLTRTFVESRAADEEAFFLGLRLNRGVDLLALKQSRGIDSVERNRSEIAELCNDGLLELEGEFLRLTPRGRLLSNDVFSRFIRDVEAQAEPASLRILQ